MAGDDDEMGVSASRYLLCRPRVPAPLAPNFVPLVLAKRQYLGLLQDSPFALDFALERGEGLAARGRLPVVSDDHEDFEASLIMAEKVIRYLLWQRGCQRLVLCGPGRLCGELAGSFAPGGRCAFEAEAMGRLMPQPFCVELASDPAQLAGERDGSDACGSVASGCRLAFDAGPCGILLAAVREGEVVDSRAQEWDVPPVDAEEHFDALLRGLTKVAAKLPQVSAIGGGISFSLDGQHKVLPTGRRLAEAFACPVKVVSHCEAMAFAGARMLGAADVCSVSLGAAVAAGYVDASGATTGWLNALAHCPLDLNPEAPKGPGSPHRGDSLMGLGHCGLLRLAQRAGVANLPPQPHDAGAYAEVLRQVQAAMREPGRALAARRVFETIGVFLGYAVAQLAEYLLELRHVLLLGCVCDGEGGQVIMEKAHEVLRTEFPAIAGITFHVLDEHTKRAGSLVAISALPRLEN